MRTASLGAMVFLKISLTMVVIKLPALNFLFAAYLQFYVTLKAFKEKKLCEKNTSYEFRIKS